MSRKRDVCVRVDPDVAGCGLTVVEGPPLPAVSGHEPGDPYVVSVLDVPGGTPDAQVVRRLAPVVDRDVQQRDQKFTYRWEDLERFPYPHPSTGKSRSGDTVMPVGQPLFLGFKSVADLAARGPKGDRLFYFPVVETEADAQGLGVATHRLIVSGLLDDGVIGYVSFDLAREAIMGGRRFGPGGEPASDPSSRIDSAVKLTKGHIRGLGMEPIEGVMARPRGYMYLSVSPTHMDYDKERDCFVRRERPD